MTPVRIAGSDLGAGLSPLQPVSLREQARAAIRASIITGQMEAGRVYSVPVLAEQFGVSLTPVREAMLDLVQEHLVETVRNKGFRVSEPSDKELQDIYEIRMMLEAPVLARLAGQLTDAARAEFATLAERIEDCAAEGDLAGFLAADRDFHLGLLGQLGNERLIEIIGSLRDQTRLYGLGDLVRSGTLMDSAREHSQILRTIADGDGQQVEGLMQHHLEHTRGLWAGRAEQPGA
jgi:DNA-binding GntR family transcriptional regulator